MSVLAAIIIVIIARIAWIARVAAVVARSAAYAAVIAAVVVIAAEYVRVAAYAEHQRNDDYNPYPIADTAVIAVVPSEKSHKITSFSIIVIYIMPWEVNVLLYVCKIGDSLNTYTPSGVFSV